MLMDATANVLGVPDDAGGAWSVPDHKQRDLRERRPAAARGVPHRRQQPRHPLHAARIQGKVFDAFN